MLASGITWFVREETDRDYNFYSCNDTSPSTGRLCWKLSGGKGTWCYFNISNNDYKICKVGWKSYDQPEIRGVEITDYISYNVNLTDKQLLERKGITNPVASSCKRISQDECVFKVTNGFNKEFKLNISGKTQESINEMIENKVILLINSTLFVEKERERIRVEKDFYAQQSYGNKKVMVIS